MTVVFSPTFKDHYSAYRSAFHRKPAAWLSYAFFLGMPLIVLLLAVALRGYTISETWTQDWQLLIWGPLFVFLGIPLLHRMNVNQQRSRNATASGVQHIDINDDGIRTWGALSNSAVLWPAVTEVVEVRRFFLIYFSEVHFLYLPKSALPTVDSLLEIRSLFARHLRERAELRGQAA